MKDKYQCIVVLNITNGLGIMQNKIAENFTNELEGKGLTVISKSCNVTCV